MYYMTRRELEQNNTAIRLSGKIDTGMYIHWLNPLFDKCEEKQ